MSSCPPCLPVPLNLFHDKLQNLTSAPLTGDERRLMVIFRRVHRKFPELSRDDSFGISLYALLKCHEKGFGRHPAYVETACIYEHVASLNCRKSRATVRRLRPLPRSPKLASPHRWTAEDVRIDLSEAIESLEADQRLALRMRLDRYCHADIARELSVSERQAYRVVQDAFRRVKERLGEDYLLAA